MSVKTERIEARFLPEIKHLAERAALISGVTLTDYLAKLVTENAPKTLKTYSEIKLTNQQFDQFMAICDEAPKPSKAILSAAKRLDDEGF
jgi:uncharacterized protein (DUF1778 family)